MIELANNLIDNGDKLGIALFGLLLISGLLWQINNILKSWQAERKENEQRNSAQFDTLVKTIDKSSDAIIENARALTEVATLIKIKDK